MRKILTLSCVALALTSATGCRSCFDSLCRFEAAKNEALFGWLRGPQPQPQTVCYDPCAQPGVPAYGYSEPTIVGPTIGAPAAGCCGDASYPGVLPTPAPAP